MKPKFLVLSLILAATTAHAAPLILPDACGKAEVEFDVKTQKNPPAPPAPEDGRAQIFVISEIPGNYVVRFGMNGGWVGANKGNSYFVITVPPGEHHFCSSIQSMFKQTMNRYVGMASFTAEAGKTYYLDYNLAVTGSGGTFVQGHNSPFAAAGTPPPTPTYVPGSSSASSGLGLAAEDEGKYRVKASPLSTSTPKK